VLRIQIPKDPHPFGKLDPYQNKSEKVEACRIKVKAGSGSATLVQFLHFVEKYQETTFLSIISVLKSYLTLDELRHLYLGLFLYGIQTGFLVSIKTSSPFVNDYLF
jgi:hypothetical protein